MLNLIENAPSLGKTFHERLNVYQSFFRKHMNLDKLTAIRNAWQTGTPLANDTFKQKIESKLSCKVGQYRRGCPKRASTP
jgi:putative transposase